MSIDLTSWSSVVSGLVSCVVMILVVFLQRLVAGLTVKDHKRHRTVKRLLVDLGSVLSRYFWPDDQRPFRVWGNVVVRCVYVLDATRIPISRVFQAVFWNVWNMSSDSCLGYVRWFRWGDRGLVFLYIGRWTTMRESEGSWSHYIGRWAQVAQRHVVEDDPPGSVNDVDMLLAAYDRRVIRVGTAYVNDRYLNMRYWHWGIVHPDVLRGIVPSSFEHIPDLPRLDPLRSVIGAIVRGLVRRDYVIAGRINYAI